MMLSTLHCPGATGSVLRYSTDRWTLQHTQLPRQHLHPGDKDMETSQGARVEQTL